MLIQGQHVLEDFDPVVEAGGAFRSFVHETQNIRVANDGVLQIDFQTKTGETILSGVELGTKALPLGPVPALPDRKTQRLGVASQEK